MTLIPAIIIGGSLVDKKFVPDNSRFPTTGLLYILVLVSVVLIVGALTFFPFFAMGPVLEHLLMNLGKTF